MPAYGAPVVLPYKKYSIHPFVYQGLIKKPLLACPLPFLNCPVHVIHRLTPGVADNLIQ
jgi:hypothetical protein